MHLPLHIFEQRYRSLVSDAMARDQRIGMVQPRAVAEGSVQPRAVAEGSAQPRDSSDPPSLFTVGCVGRISDIEALEDGRFNIVLEGEARFRILRELDVTTAFRQVEAEMMSETEDDPGILSSPERAALESESRKFAEVLGYGVDWDAVGRLDDETFVNAIAQVAPFDVASKQALLEAGKLGDRSEMLIQLMQFHIRNERPGSSRLQ